MELFETKEQFKSRLKSWISVLVLATQLFTACGSPNTSSTPSQDPSPKSKASANTLAIGETSSGFFTSLSIHLTASQDSTDFIQRELIHQLPAAGKNHPEFHVTLLIADGSTTSSLSRRRAVFTQLKNELKQLLKNDPTMLQKIPFAIEGIHTLPNNHRFVLLVPNAATSPAFVHLQGKIHQLIENRIQSLSFSDAIQIKPNSNPANFMPHMTIFKTDLNSAPLSPSVFNQIVTLIDQRISDLRSQNRLIQLDFHSIQMTD